MSYDDYWTLVIGDQWSAESLIDSFDLTLQPAKGPGSLDEWLGQAEATALAELCDGPVGATPSDDVGWAWEDSTGSGPLDSLEELTALLELEVQP